MMNGVKLWIAKELARQALALAQGNLRVALHEQDEAKYRVLVCESEISRCVKEFELARRRHNEFKAQRGK